MCQVASVKDWIKQGLQTDEKLCRREIQPYDTALYQLFKRKRENRQL